MNKTDFSLEAQTNWARLATMRDDDIDFSDLPELSDEQLQAMQPTRRFFAERGLTYAPKPVETITIYHDDGTVTTHSLAPHGNLITLDPDVQRYFPDSAAVNHTLRALLHLVPTVHPVQQ
jgi:hypothetical protein